MKYTYKLRRKLNHQITSLIFRLKLKIYAATLLVDQYAVFEAGDALIKV